MEKIIRSGFVYLVLGVVALWLRVADLGLFVTHDEVEFWFSRSDSLLLALQSGDYAAMDVSTHPGVTTMWLGAAGIALRRWLFAQGWLQAETFALLVAFFRLPVVLVHVSGVLVGYAMLRRMLPATIAGLAAFLWATDPFIVGYSRLLHVDALMGTFATLSLLAATLYWNYAAGVRWLVLSALFAGLALLSKSPALALVPLVGVLALTSAGQGLTQSHKERKDLGKRWYFPTDSLRGRLRAQVGPLLLWGIGVLVTIVALWPVLWVNPVHAYEALRAGVTAEGAQPHMTGNFFLGERVAAPGWLFYPVALVLRMTPWTLLGVLLLPLAVWRMARGDGRRETDDRGQPVSRTLLVTSVQPLGAQAARLPQDSDGKVRAGTTNNTNNTNRCGGRDVARNVSTTKTACTIRVPQVGGWHRQTPTLSPILPLPTESSRTLVRSIVLLVGFILLFVLAMSLFPKKFNRYIVPVFPAVDIVAAVGLVGVFARRAKTPGDAQMETGDDRPQTVDKQRRTTVVVDASGKGNEAQRHTSLRTGEERPETAARYPPVFNPLARLFASVVAVVALLNVLWWHPYAIAAFNQAAGGARAGAETFVVGWGEGLEQVAAWLNQQPDIQDVLTISHMITSLDPYLRDGARATFPRQGVLKEGAGYVVVYIPQVQGGPPPAPFDRFYARRTPLHTVHVHGVAYAWVYAAPPPVEQVVGARFGSAVELHGFAQGAALQAGEPLSLRLVWQAHGHVAQDYWVFAHLLGPDGQRYAQVDQQYQMSQWQPGVFVEQELLLTLPADAPRGKYRVVLGVYDIQSGERLALLAKKQYHARGYVDGLLLVQNLW
jgi:hypothetical protein